MPGYGILNNAAVRDLASLVLKENIVQEILVLPYRSADFRYTEDMNARSVTVNRPKLITGGRTIGDTTNGGFFNSSVASAESELYDINLTQVFDKPIKIAQVQDDLSGGTALRGSLMNVPKSIARFVNCTYFASLVVANMQKAIKATSQSGNITYSTDADYATVATEDTTAGVIAALQKATGVFESGDAEHGYDLFPLEESVVYGSGEFLNYLRGQSNFIVNNVIGQQMIGSGSFDAFDATWTPDSIRGYAGEIYGMLLYRTGSLFKATAGYIGKLTLANNTKAATSATALDNLLAIVVCGLAVGGGMTPGDIKVVDARGGQGWEIQPLARCGFEVFSAKGVHTIWKTAGYTATDFVTYTGAASVATQTVKPVIYQPENR